jgi:trehalose synthase
VPISPVSPERFRGLLGDAYEAVERAAVSARSVLDGRAVWHVNSTARGGGVAEMLQSLLAYAGGAGVDVRWLTIAGDEGFFRVTKRIHNRLHGSAGDGGELGPAERSQYEGPLGASAAALNKLVRPGDVVYLHDPQTAGLAEPMRNLGATVIWRCHVGVDAPNELVRSAWSFLTPYVAAADAYVFSRRAFAWSDLDADRLWFVPPSIDAFSPKNQDLAGDAITSILATMGLGSDAGVVAAAFRRQDGSAATVRRTAEIDQDAPVPGDIPLVAQVSRWDRLKDPAGVLECFERHVGEPSHLVLAGPSVAEVADDPEGAEVLAEVRARRGTLPDSVRARTHLVCLPMDDVDENAAMVNAIQRRANVVLQKSIAEGFGLTVAEAMWKSRPVVAGKVGGIQDQIVDGQSGLLVDDPADLEAVGAAIDSLLSDPARAAEIGAAARERVLREFLGTRHLVQYMDLIETLLRGRS